MRRLAIDRRLQNKLPHFPITTHQMQAPSSPHRNPYDECRYALDCGGGTERCLRGAPVAYVSK